MPQTRQYNLRGSLTAASKLPKQGLVTMKSLKALLLALTFCFFVVAFLGGAGAEASMDTSCAPGSYPLIRLALGLRTQK